MQLFKNKVQSRQKLTETYSMCAPISVHHAWRQLYGVSQSECGVLNNVTGYVFYPLITVIWHFTVNNNTDMLFLNSYLTVGWRMRWTSTVATVTQCSTLFLQPTRDYIHNRAADTEQVGGTHSSRQLSHWLKHTGACLFWLIGQAVHLSSPLSFLKEVPSFYVA